VSGIVATSPLAWRRSQVSGFSSVVLPALGVDQFTTAVLSPSPDFEVRPARLVLPFTVAVGQKRPVTVGDSGVEDSGRLPRVLIFSGAGRPSVSA
jgi:hypothetical protein